MKGAGSLVDEYLTMDEVERGEVRSHLAGWRVDTTGSNGETSTANANELKVQC